MFSGDLLGCQSFLSPNKHVEGTTQHQFQQEDQRFDGGSKQRVKYAVFGDFCQAASLESGIKTNKQKN